FNAQSKTLDLLEDKNRILKVELEKMKQSQQTLVRLGGRVFIDFSVVGKPARHNYLLVPTSSPVYAIAFGGSPEIKFQSQDGVYNLQETGMDTSGKTRYSFSTSFEVLNAQYPIGNDFK